MLCFYKNNYENFLLCKTSQARKETMIMHAKKSFSYSLIKWISPANFPSQTQRCSFPIYSHTAFPADFAAAIFLGCTKTSATGPSGSIDSNIRLWTHPTKDRTCCAPSLELMQDHPGLALWKFCLRTCAYNVRVNSTWDAVLYYTAIPNLEALRLHIGCT